MKIRTVLYADEGTVLTNGTDYAAIVWLADGASAENYYAITQEEYSAIQEKQNAALLQEV